MATVTCCSGECAGLLLVISGFDDAIGFDFILNALGFSCVVRDGQSGGDIIKERHSAEPFRNLPTGGKQILVAG